MWMYLKAILLCEEENLLSKCKTTTKFHFYDSMCACYDDHLRVPSARTPTSPAGRRPVMPLVRYRKVAILGYRSVGKSPPSREDRKSVV